MKLKQAFTEHLLRAQPGRALGSRTGKGPDLALQQVPLVGLRTEQHSSERENHGGELWEQLAEGLPVAQVALIRKV